MTEAQIQEILKTSFGDIAFQEEPEDLYAPLHYMVEIGGKRIRPYLCLMTHSFFRDLADDSIIQPAIGLELFHSFTLIHDDIMDKSPLRRGVPTVWTKWGEDAAILSGDAMCIESFRRISYAPKEVLGNVLGLFVDTAAKVCDGQQYDMDFEKTDLVPMQDYMRMIGLKTGVLIACAAKMGAIIGGASQSACDSLYEYGYNLGLAFQVADDYLDAFGDENVFGKPIGGDIINKKKSWLTNRLFEKVEPEIKDEVLQLIVSEVGSDEDKKNKVAKVIELYRKYGIDSEAKEEIVRLNSIALDFASKAVSGDNLSMLVNFAARLIERKK